MDIIYRAMWRHRQGSARRSKDLACHSGRGALLRLALALVLISVCVGLLDGAASQVRLDEDAGGTVIVQTREGD